MWEEMSFIGIISDKKEFESIRQILLKHNEGNVNYKNIIYINMHSIDNVQNIKFETIIINSDLKKFINYEETLKKICKKCEYLIVNTDIEMLIDILEEQKVNIITFGLNQKATVTISSISSTDVSIFLQRNIINVKKKIVEVEEKHIKLSEKKELKVYEILIVYIIIMIYEDKILEDKEEIFNFFK